MLSVGETNVESFVAACGGVVGSGVVVCIVGAAAAVKPFSVGSLLSVACVMTLLGMKCPKFELSVESEPVAAAFAFSSSFCSRIISAFLRAISCFISCLTRMRS